MKKFLCFLNLLLICFAFLQPIKAQKTTNHNIITASQPENVVLSARTVFSIPKITANFQHSTINYECILKNYALFVPFAGLISNSGDKLSLNRKCLFIADINSLFLTKNKFQYKNSCYTINKRLLPFARYVSC